MRTRRLSAGLLFAAGLLTTSYFGGKILALYLLLWIGLVAVDLIYFQLIPPSLPCTLELPATCLKGQKVTAYLHVVQDGKLPIFHGMARLHLKSFFYRQEENLELDITLMGEEEGIAAFDLKVPYLGLMEITLNEAEIYDLMGLRKKTILSSMKKYLMIMPNTREIKMDVPDLGNMDPQGEEIRDTVYGYDPGTYQGIRPFRDGDSLKNIHWKLTSKTGEIMVKELGIPSGREPRLFLDTRLPDLQPKRIDALIENYFSFSMALVDQGRPHILCWKDGGITAQEYRIENMPMLEEALEPMFHIQFCQDSTQKGNGTWIYYMSHDEMYTFGYYYDDGCDYLEPVAFEERLWNEGR